MTASSSGTVEWAQPSKTIDTVSVSIGSTGSDTVSSINSIADTVSNIEQEEFIAYTDTAILVDSAVTDLKVHPFATVGFLTAIAGLGVSAYTPVLCIVAIIFCGIALDRIKRKPEKFKGKRLASWGLIIAAAGLLTYLAVALVVGL